MKKILYLLCVLLFTSTVYASDIDVQDKIKENIFATGLYNTNYISIDRAGQIAYIVDSEEINALMIKLEDILKRKEFTQYSAKDQKKELKPVKDFQYRISLYDNDTEQKQALMFFIYNSGEINVIANHSEIREIWLEAEELNQFLSFVATLYEKQYKYDVFLTLNSVNLTGLGSILDGEVYIFKDAFLDEKGCLYISMSDWDAIFAPTYGATKKLSIHNGEVFYQNEVTGVKSKKHGECLYLPLRKMVGYFPYLTLEWDGMLKKAVIAEKGQAFWKKKAEEYQQS
ncbi:MAG: hypothetical protein PHU31_09135 [Anaerotignum sp.]|nr:hypothetical protein [Anaerotignum sp.]